MRKKWNKIMKNRSGEGYPLAAAVTLALLMLILIITQYAHLLINSVRGKGCHAESGHIHRK